MTAERRMSDCPHQRVRAVCFQCQVPCPIGGYKHVADFDYHAPRREPTTGDRLLATPYVCATCGHRFRVDRSGTMAVPS